MVRIRDWLSWWLHIPDRKVGWFFPAFAIALREGLRWKPDVVFSTAPMWTSHLIAEAVSITFQVPWIADFRDPWCGSDWRHIPYVVHRRLDEWMEHQVVHRSGRITCAVDSIRRHMINRYPGHAGHFRTVINGFDPEQVDNVPPVEIADGRCVLIHTGTFYGPRSPQPLFSALRKLIAEYPNEAALLHVELVGPTEYDGVSLADIARQYGVRHLVSIREVVPYRESIGLLKGADLAMLFGQSGKKSITTMPAKVFDYIGLSKPVLAIGAGDEACALIQEGGCQLWRADAEALDVLVDRLRDIIRHYREGRLQCENREARYRFRRSLTAERLAAEIQSVLSRPFSQRSEKDG